MTPKAWLLRERLQRAQLLLESSDLSLARIADASGFGSLDTLRTAFRRVLHTSPQRYRRQFRAADR